MENVKEYPVRSAANERARSAFYKVNEADDELLRSVYPNGCTLAEAIGFFEGIGEDVKASNATAERQHIAHSKMHS